MNAIAARSSALGSALDFAAAGWLAAALLLAPRLALSRALACTGLDRPRLPSLGGLALRGLGLLALLGDLRPLLLLALFLATNMAQIAPFARQKDEARGACPRSSLRPGAVGDIARCPGFQIASRNRRYISAIEQVSENL